MMGVIAIGGLLILAIVALGRGPRGFSGLVGGFATAVRPSADGKQVLEQLCARYQAIQSYEDRTLMRLKFPVENRWQEEVVDALVRFVRPHAVRLHFNLPTIQLLVTSDGQQINSRILDQGNKQLDQQLVRHVAPPELSLQSLFTATEIVSTEVPQVQSILMNLPCPLAVSQMSFLFDLPFVKQLIDSSDRIERLPDRALGGHLCARVELTSPAGRFVFWVDDQQGLLRRIEYPNSAAQSEASNSDDRQGTSAMVMLSVDYDNVRVDAAFPPGGFRQRPPQNAVFVRHFVVPPVRSAADVLGRRVSNYWFTDLAGGQLRADQLNAAVNVLVWFNNRAPSRAVLEQLNKIYQARPESVNILGVCTEPTTTMSHEEVRRLQAEWKLEFPVVRDLQAFGRDVFGVNQAPTLVAIDSNETVQLFEVGGNSEMSEQLPIVFDKIRAGEPLAQQYLDFLDQQAEDYRQLLTAAKISASGEGPPVSDSSRPPATEKPASPNQADVPSESSGLTGDRVRLDREWSVPLADEPLRLVCILDAGLETRVLAAGDEPVIHEVSIFGKRSQSFPLIEVGGPREMRLFASRQASLFATFSERGSVSVFDHRWISRFTYPAIRAPRVEVRDVVAADLDDNGEPELYVALGDREVHCVDVTGKLNWSLDNIHGLRSLTVSHDQTGQQFLLVADGTDQITPLSATGERHEPIRLNRPILRLLASARPADDGAFCAVSGDPNDGLLVLGLDAGFQEIWQQKLPANPLGDPPQRVSWVPWEADAQKGFWLIHSSAHELRMVSEDGTIVRSVTMKLPLSCVAGTVYDNRNYLLGTSGGTLMAWSCKMFDQTRPTSSE